MTGRTLADCLKTHPNPAGRMRGNSSSTTGSSSMSGSSNGGGSSMTGDMGTKK
jgi:hypothetical protein